MFVVLGVASGILAGLVLILSLWRGKLRKEEVLIFSGLSICFLLIHHWPRPFPPFPHSLLLYLMSMMGIGGIIGGIGMMMRK